MDSKTHNQLQTLANIIVAAPNKFEEVFFMLGQGVSPVIKGHMDALHTELVNLRSRCNSAELGEEEVREVQETLKPLYPEVAQVLSSALARKKQST